MSKDLDLSINSAQTSQEIIQFLQKTLHDTGFSKLVLGLSGGIDSTVSLALATQAIGAEHIQVGIFPYGKLQKDSVADAQLVADVLKIPEKNRYVVDIENIVDTIMKKVDRVKRGDVLRKGNIAVRIRMILLFDLAKKENALVLGTENKTEYLLGYFTRFGDEASDIEPLQSLYKTQVRQLASFLEIPQKIIDKAPTPGMWVGQTDEDEFGFTYGEADKILHLYIDKKKRREEIEKEGMRKEVIEKVLERMKRNEFKHQVPYSFLSQLI